MKKAAFLNLSTEIADRVAKEWAAVPIAQRLAIEDQLHDAKQQHRSQSDGEGPRVDGRRKPLPLGWSDEIAFVMAQGAGEQEKKYHPLGILNEYELGLIEAWRKGDQGFLRRACENIRKKTDKQEDDRALEKVLLEHWTTTEGVCLIWLSYAAMKILLTASGLRIQSVAALERRCLRLKLPRLARAIVDETNIAARGSGYRLS